MTNSSASGSLAGNAPLVGQMSGVFFLASARSASMNEAATTRPATKIESIARVNLLMTVVSPRDEIMKAVEVERLGLEMKPETDVEPLGPEIRGIEPERWLGRADERGRDDAGDGRRL